ncbi:MAG: hypothetical protein ACUVWX_05595 [Kiritimatiellia bacterium]
MGRLLRGKSGDATGETGRVLGLSVQGVRYTNTAAKFWASLLDEIHADYPACSLVELTTSDGSMLNPEQLFPEIELEREIERLTLADVETEISNTLAQLELLGPPGAVEICLFAEQKEILRCPLPDECVDAEIFPYLLVWLLEWSETPSAEWNDPIVCGKVTALDRRRRRRYRLEFELQNRHLSEDLYRRVLKLWPTIEKLR